MSKTIQQAADFYRTCHPYSPGPTPRQIRAAVNGPWPEPARTEALRGTTLGEFQRRLAAKDALRDIEEDVHVVEQDPLDPRDFDTW